jgi:hypothetical protein
MQICFGLNGCKAVSTNSISSLSSSAIRMAKGLYGIYYTLVIKITAYTNKNLGPCQIPFRKNTSGKIILISNAHVTRVKK